jgi:hypothetical protein
VLIPALLQEPTGLIVLITTAVVFQTSYLAIHLWRLAAGGRVLLELSKPNRRWLWLAGVGFAAGLATTFYEGPKLDLGAVVMFAQGAMFAAQGSFGVQLRERGISIPLEFVPWRRLDVSLTDPARVSVTIRRPLNWDSTWDFPVSQQEHARIAAILGTNRQSAARTDG